MKSAMFTPIAVSEIPRRTAKREGRWQRTIREFLESDAQAGEVEALNARAAVVALGHAIEDGQPVKVLQRGERVFLIREAA